MTETGSPGCLYSGESRGRINGAVIGTADDAGIYAIPSYFGPYPPGTQVTFELQYEQRCAGITSHLPAGRLMVLPYALP